MDNFFLFLPGIATLGILSSYTDLKYGRIRNVHLFAAFFYGCVGYSYLFFSNRLGYKPLVLFGNFFVTAILSYILYIRQFWSAGDAKLFIVFSFLCPWFVYSGIFWLPAFSLLVHIGIFSLIYMLLFDAKAILDRLVHFSRKDVVLWTKQFCRALAMVFSITWIISYFMPKLHIKDQFLKFVFTYLGYFLLYAAVKRMRSRRWALVFILAAGILLRFFINPGIFFSAEKMFSYVWTVVKLTVFFTLLNAVFLPSSSIGGRDIHFKKNEIAYAPIMFLGILSLQFPLAFFVEKLIKTIR